MSGIVPEVTDELVAFLYARTDHGVGKYGTPLLPFDGRNTLMDAIEESSDQLQYLWKRRMENLAIADLCVRAAEALKPYEQPVLDELYSMASKLRADCERSVPMATYRGPAERLAAMDREPAP